ncbi:MAG TPA: hypothetical protein VKA49_13985 [Flavitalea sp.]|nr:hypothetical protein [Flavitalea sp.]
MKKSVSVLRNISLVILSVSFFLASCSKDKDIAAPAASFAGQYLVADDTETYILKVENKGGNNFQIIEFGGFLNAPLKAVAEGNTLKIPSQTFTNPNGKKLTVVGTGVLATKNSKDDTITFQYTVSGFANYDGDFTGTRK